MYRNINNLGVIREFSIEKSLPSEIAYASLKTDGVICLRNAHDRNWLDLIENGIESAVSGLSEDIDVVKKNNDSGAFTFSSQAWRQVKPFEEAIFLSRAPDIAWSLLKSKSLVLFYDFLLIKEAEAGSADTPWHQDHSYYPLHGAGVINCWTALDHIPLETSLRFWRGSQQQSQLYKAANFSGNSSYKHVRNSEPEIPPIDNDLEAEIISCELFPGDMLVWDSYTFHSAPGNNLNRRRAAFSLNWTRGDIRFRDIPCLSSYRAAGLYEGSLIVCDKFPQVRP